MDQGWWHEYIREVKRTFQGSLGTIRHNQYGVRVWQIRHYCNSGAGAISLSIRMGADRIILLGYDMQHTGGKRHWHGDHPRRLANAGNLKDFLPEFDRLRRHHPLVEIVNCTRVTALTAFPIVNLEEALNEYCIASGG